MGSSNQQLYSLSWGEFGSSLTSAVQLLRGQGDLVDVTLAAGGKSFPAHKIVLSAASPFLLDLLKSTPCQHPVVMLAGVGAEDLESLLEFVYRGEVSVEPSQLPSLLQAAHCLSIHGLTPPTILTENGEEIPASAIPSGTEPPTREIMNTCMPMQRKKKRRKSSSTSMPSGKWPRSDHGDSDDRGHDSHHSNERTTDYEHSKDGESGPHDDMGDSSKGRSVSDQPTTCPLCGAILRQSRNLRRHLELLHFGLGNNSKPGIRMKRRKSEISDFHRSSLATVRPAHTHSHNTRASDNSDYSTPVPLSLASVVTSAASNLSLPGNLMGPVSSLSSISSMLGQQDPSGHTIPGITSSSCGTTMPGPSNNGIYSSDSASMLSCLLPNLPPLSSPHDIFRHGEMLRGMGYHDTSREHARDVQRSDVA
ncbi:uncharacterized protein [Venturia canescens]|uniref:uncharacterized protein isoform X3 n=1 Tax=Venturia canescens TaxID=32260 RepID=UPI001C9C4785|nr:uncharacterized protein LOC122412544 isoform X3 [Venturia canescens]